MIGKKIIKFFIATAFLVAFFQPLSEVFAVTFPAKHNWAKRLGGTGVDGGYAVTTDTSNNVIVVGNVVGAADLNFDGDATDGVAETGSGYGLYDGVISVFNSSGTHQWSKRMGGSSYDFSLGVVTDTSDNIIITGYVYGAADLNFDGDATDGVAETGVGYGGYDVFITVFDSSGTWLWAKRLGGSSTDRGYDLIVDGSDNIIVGGVVSSTADLNGDGDKMDGVAETTSQGNEDPFVSVFNNSGTHQWAARFGSSSTDRFGGLAVDGSNNVVVIGTVHGDADINGDGDRVDGTLEDVSVNSYDAFISVFDSSGTYQWAKRLGGTSSDYGEDVFIDSSNNIVTVGNISGAGDLNGDEDSTDGAVETTGYGGSDAFISVFDNFGTHQWSKRLGGDSSDSGSSVSIDSNDDIFIAGYVSGAGDLNGDGDSTDGGPESIINATDGYNRFVSVFNFSGTYQWAKRLGGSGNNLIESIAHDSNDNLIVSGRVYGDADMNADTDSVDGGAESATGFGSSDAFVSVFQSTVDTNVPTVSLNPLSPDPYTGSSPVVTGTATDVGGTVGVVRHLLDSTAGNWSVCTADDGAFDESSESFSCSFETPDGNHTLYIEAMDDSGNYTTSSHASDSFTISDSSISDQLNITNNSTSNNIEHPDIAIDSNGNSHIAFVFNREIYYTMLDEDGTTLIDDTLIHSGPADGDDTLPAIQVDSNNKVHIAWHNGDHIIEYTKLDPYLDAMDGSASDNATLTLVEDKQVGSSSNTVHVVRMAIDSSNNIHFVWEGYNADENLYYAKTDSNGDILIAETMLRNTGESRVNAHIDVDSNDNPHIVWNDGAFTQAETMYMMLDGSDASVLIAATALTADDGSQSKRPRIAIDSQNKAHVVYQDLQGSTHEIYYVKVDPSLDDQSGDAASLASITEVANKALTADDGLISRYPSISLASDDYLHINWEENYADVGFMVVNGSGEDVVSERTLTSVGKLSYNSTWQLLGIATNSSNRASVVWTDIRDSTYYDVFYTTYQIISASSTTTASSSSDSGSKSRKDPQISSSNGGGLTVFAIQERDLSNSSNQIITSTLQAGTLKNDAYLSATETNPGDLVNDIISLHGAGVGAVNDGFSLTLPDQSNAVIAGGIKGKIGIKKFFNHIWQVGPIQRLFYRALHPDKYYDQANPIIPEFQYQESLVSLSYTYEDLIPPGSPDIKFDESELKLAQSTDGVVWEVLDTSVVDINNRTVSFIGKIYGYYTIVGSKTVEISQ